MVNFQILKIMHSTSTDYSSLYTRLGCTLYLGTDLRFCR